MEYVSEHEEFWRGNLPFKEEDIDDVAVALGMPEEDVRELYKLSILILDLDSMGNRGDDLRLAQQAFHRFIAYSPRAVQTLSGWTENPV